MLTQPSEKCRDLFVAPHPGREALEGRVGGGRGRATANLAVDGRRIGPVSLDCDDREPLLLDQAPRNRIAGAVEFGGAVAGLAEQNDAGIGEAVDEFGEGRIVDTGQQFGMLTYDLRRTDR